MQYWKDILKFFLLKHYFCLSIENTQCLELLKKSILKYKNGSNREFESVWRPISWPEHSVFYLWTMNLLSTLLLGPKRIVGGNLDSILKSRDITLPTKVSLVKVMVFPVVMYGCESWTIKKAECQRIDAFELWCWRRLFRVPWTARRSNQSILKETSPGCSLEGLML